MSRLLDIALQKATEIIISAAERVSTDTKTEKNALVYEEEKDASKSTDEEDVLVKRMREMLVNAKDCLADVILVCADGKIPCHANILVSGSTFFKVSFV